MKSEALRNLRTMRQVKTGLGLARGQKLRTTNSLSKVKGEIEHLDSLQDRRLEQILAGESKRFAAQQASLDKSRQRVLRSRERLAMTINRNRALTELRQELQRARWEENDLPAPKAEQLMPEQNLRPIELKY
jgi:hypothetical protein